MASGRLSRSKSTLLTRAVLDQSALDVSATLTALTASAALGLSLASVIRQANGFDVRDKAYASEYLSKTIATPASVTQTTPETSPPVAAKGAAPALKPAVVAAAKAEPETIHKITPEPVLAAVSAVPELEEAPKASPMAAAVAAVTKVLPFHHKEEESQAPSPPVITEIKLAPGAVPEHVPELITLTSQVGISKISKI